MQSLKQFEYIFNQPGNDGELCDLREQLTELIEQQEELEFHKKPVLMAIYNCEIGLFELSLLQHQLDRQRLKCKLELLTARINRGETINYSMIKKVDDQVEAEFIKWKVSILRREKQLYESEKLMASVQEMSDDESKKFKSIYRKICKLIHPDLTKMTSLSDQFWQPVQIAYGDGDIDQLDSLLILIEGQFKGKVIYHGGEYEYERLRKLIFSLSEKLKNLQDKVPYCYEEKLLNRDWVNQKQLDLMENIEITLQEVSRYKGKLELVMSFSETVH